MGKLTEAQMAKKDLVDAIRTVVRLQARVEQRRRLNEIEAEALAEFDRRLAAGEPYKVDVKALLAGEL